MKGKARTANETATARPPQWAMVALAAVGAGISLYLTVVHYSNVPLICVGASGCETVNHSAYSEVAGVAVAALGLGGYIAILAALWAERQHIVKRDEAVLLVLGFSLAGTLYSAYLTYVEIVILRAICSWCVVSAVTMTAIFALAVQRWLEAIRVSS